MSPKNTSDALRSIRRTFKRPLSLALAVLFAASGAVISAAVAQSAKAGDAAQPRDVAKQGDADKAEIAFVEGARLLEKQDLAGAQAAFALAQALNPRKLDYKLAFELTRAHRVSMLVQEAAKARLAGQVPEAAALMAQAAAIDPASELVQEHTEAGQSINVPAAPKARITPANQVMFTKPIEVQPLAVAQQFDIRGNARQVIEQVARAYGVKTVFDGSVTSGEALPTIHFILDQSPYSLAMPALLKMTKMFAVAVDAKELLIARDTQENRARLERQAEETIYVPASTPEELNELTNIIKNVFDVKQVSISATSGTLAVRAPLPTLKALNATLKDLIDGDAEVLMEIKLVSVDKSRTVNTGAQTPTSIGAFSIAGEAQTIINNNQSLVQTLISTGGYVPNSAISNQQNQILEALILVLSGAVQDAKVSGLIALAGNGLTLTGIDLGSGATLNFGLNSSDVRALDDISIRVGDRQTATLKVGEKYPITTATYSSGISSTTASALSGVSINGVSASQLLSQFTGSTANIPQVQYEDLGLTLKVTPVVLRSGLIDMKVDMKIESLTGASLDNIPVLTSSVYTSDITLADGASAMMLSNLSKTESAAIAGLPGLSELPGFKESAADDLREVSSSELMLMVTPHIVRHRKDLTASERIPFQPSVPPEF
jgi:type II secretory pathway component GspD/PulD (secretin)